MEKMYDVVIVGASFAGLSLAKYLPENLRILVVDAKSGVGSSVESTGLITSKTREEFSEFLDIDEYITESMRSICVVAPDFKKYFISHTQNPWIFQTDTKALVKHMAEILPANVTVEDAIFFHGVDTPAHVQEVRLLKNGKIISVQTRFLVGADGAISKVASCIPQLQKNKKFLFGHEQVFFGKIHLGDRPEETIYHFWFGEFSLGYGGWISPTIVDGKPAFRIGLAKLLKDRDQAKRLMRDFVNVLLERKMITIEGDIDAPGYLFSGIIPIGGALSRISYGNTLLLGNAAGLCGAFAADGIKGSVISGKEAAPLIVRFLDGEKCALRELGSRINHHGGLMDYFRRQLRYRWIWNIMKRDRTFDALYSLVEKEKATFVDQFCDSKDKRKSLMRVVLKWRNFFAIIRYAWYMAIDFIFPL